MTTETKTILVIDGEPMMRTAIGSILKAHAYSVLAAADGREGLDLFYMRRPALIICDVMLPERDGFQTIGALRDAGVQVPIVASAESKFYCDNAELFLRIALAVGADAAILKPPSATAILEAVEDLLRCGATQS